MRWLQAAAHRQRCLALDRSLPRMAGSAHRSARRGVSRLSGDRFPAMGGRATADVGGVQWSPDGRYVYFTTWSPNADRLWRVDANGQGRRLLFSSPASGDLLSELSPDGKWILVRTIGGPSIEQLSVMTAGGLGLHTVIFPPFAGEVNAAAVWSPRGDLLLVAGGVQTVPLPGMSAQFGYVVRPAGGAAHNCRFQGSRRMGFSSRRFGLRTSGSSHTQPGGGPPHPHRW